MSRWQDVLDYQLEVCEFWRSGQGKQFAAAYQEDRASKNKLEGEQLGPEGIRLAYQELVKFTYAEPIWVAPDIQTIIESASDSFEPEPLQPSDLLTDHGFALFPRPFLLEDVQGKMTAWRAIAWYPAGMRTGPVPREHAIVSPLDSQFDARGISLSIYSHRDDWEYEDPNYQEGCRNSPRRLTLLHMTPWLFEQALPSADNSDWLQRDDVAPEQVYRTYSTLWRTVQTFFRLSMQNVTTRERELSYRPARRRAHRLSVPKETTDYTTVIQLRRPYSKGTGNQEGNVVHWTHRWAVAGHWRKQWYPSIKMHRQIYINPYIKGDDHLPLIIRKGRAFEFVR